MFPSFLDHPIYSYTGWPEKTFRTLEGHISVRNKNIPMKFQSMEVLSYFSEPYKFLHPCKQCTANTDRLVKVFKIRFSHC